MPLNNIHSYRKQPQHEILGLKPQNSGMFAFATDTKKLFVSHDGGWIEFDNPTRKSKTHMIGETELHDVYTHFDANDHVYTFDDQPIQHGDIVYRWNSMNESHSVVGEEGPYPLGGRSGKKYSRPQWFSDGVNGKPAVVFCNEDTMQVSNLGRSYLTDVDHKHEHHGPLTGFMVYQSTGINGWYSNADGSIGEESNGQGVNWKHPRRNQYSSSFYGNRNAGVCMGKNSASEYNDRTFKFHPEWTYNSNTDYSPVYGVHSYHSPTYLSRSNTNMLTEHRVAPKIFWFVMDHHARSDKETGDMWFGINGYGDSKRYNLGQIQMPKTQGVTLGGFYGLKMCELIVTHGTFNWDQINNLGTHLTNKWGLVQWDELVGTLR